MNVEDRNKNKIPQNNNVDGSKILFQNYLIWVKVVYKDMINIKNYNNLIIIIVQNSYMNGKYL